MSKLRHD